MSEQFVIEAEASRDETGHDPLPRRIGPFPSREAAHDYMDMQLPLWGSWQCAPLTAPEWKCTHCGRRLKTTDGRWWQHDDGGYRGKQRCDPDDSGLRYGYNGHPTGTEGDYPGCLCTEDTHD